MSKRSALSTIIEACEGPAIIALVILASCLIVLLCLVFGYLCYKYLWFAVVMASIVVVMYSFVFVAGIYSLIKKKFK